MAEYTDIVHLLRKQQADQNLAANQEANKALQNLGQDNLARFLQGRKEEQSLSEIEAKKQAEIALREQSKKEFDTMLQQNPKAAFHTPGGYGYTPHDESSVQLRKAQAEALNNERVEKATTAGSKALIDSNLPQMQGTLQRLESITPGAVSGSGKLKSVGGLKNLVPDAIVTILEKSNIAPSIFPAGSSQERAALQDLLNIKIYDSTGKQINEQEMRNIKTALGMRGILDPKAIEQALNQMGMTSLMKVSTAEAGIRPEARALLQERGAANSDALKRLVLGGTAKIRVRHKQSGQTGTLDAHEFDPMQYDKL